MIDKSEANGATEPQPEGRLQRWARRKTQQRKEKQTQAQEINEASAESDLVAEPVAEEEAPAPVLTDTDMPPVESLGVDSDFSGFMSPGVSEELRKLALRKMFSLPSFKIRDGLDDYDDDFTVFEPLGDTVTNDPWTKRQKRLAQEREEAERLELEQRQQAAEQAEQPAELGDESEQQADEQAQQQDKNDDQNDGQNLDAASDATADHDQENEEL